MVGVKHEDGKIEIIAVSCKEANGIARGDIRNIDQIVRSVQDSLTGLEQEYGIKVREAYVGLSGQHIKCLKHEGYVFIVNGDEEVREEDVVKLSESMKNIEVPAGETIIHILPQSYILDGDSDIPHPVGMIGKKLEGVFNISTGEKKSINLIARCLARNEVGIAEIILNSLASADAVLIEDEKELGVAVIDIGGGTTDICIYYDSVIRYLGVIPIGGNIINKDIRTYGILEKHVERLKTKFGSAVSDLVPENQVITIPGINNSPSREIPNRVLASIIEARMLDVIDRVVDVLENTGFRNRLSAGIVLTGGGALLKDLDKLFQKHVGCDVRVARPSLHITGPLADMVSSPVYSTGIGLLIRGGIIGKKTDTITLHRSRPVSGADESAIFIRPSFETNSKGKNYHDVYKAQDITSRRQGEIDFNDQVHGPGRIQVDERLNGNTPEDPKKDNLPPRGKKPKGKSWLTKFGERVKNAIDSDELDDGNDF